MNQLEPKQQNVPAAPSITESASFHFGSGRQYSTPLKQKQCIIHRSQTRPALFGQRAQNLSARLSA
jgi:hypothetical protein